MSFPEACICKVTCFCQHVQVCVGVGAIPMPRGCLPVPLMLACGTCVSRLPWSRKGGGRGRNRTAPPPGRVFFFSLSAVGEGKKMGVLGGVGETPPRKQKSRGPGRASPSSSSGAGVFSRLSGCGSRQQRGLRAPSGRCRGSTPCCHEPASQSAHAGRWAGCGPSSSPVSRCPRRSHH